MDRCRLSLPADRNRFLESIRRTRRTASHDCLVGISGGADSTRVLYSMVKDYGLKVQAFTFDNGFLSNEALQNIACIVDDLEVDHFFYSMPDDLQEKVYHLVLKRLGTPCFACSSLTYISSVHQAVIRRIPLVIHGRDPAQLFKEFHSRSFDPFLPFLLGNLKTFDACSNRKMMLRALGKALSLLSWGLDRNSRRRIRDEVFPLEFSSPGRIPPEVFPEFLGYFVFHPYESGEGEDRAPFTRLSSHADCMVHDAAEYLRKRVAGCTLAEAETAAGLRLGMIDRNTAGERMSLFSEAADLPLESLACLGTAAGLSSGWEEDAVSSARRRYRWMKPALRLRSLLHPENTDVR